MSKVTKSISIYEVWTMQNFEKEGDPDRCWEVVLLEKSNVNGKVKTKHKRLKRFFFANEPYGSPNFGEADRAAKAKAEKWAAASRRRRKIPEDAGVQGVNNEQ